MILERVVEVRVRAQCDSCKRNQGVFRRQVDASQVQAEAAEAVRLGEASLEAEDVLTGQRWLSRRGLHICPVCAKGIRAMEAVTA